MNKWGKRKTTVAASKSNPDSFSVSLSFVISTNMENPGRQEGSVIIPHIYPHREEN